MATITPSNSTIIDNVNLLLLDTSIIKPNQPYVTYISTTSIPGRIATIRDATGYVSTGANIYISTMSSVIFADGTSSLKITQPFGFVTLTSRSTNTWAVINTFAFPDPLGTANVSNVNVTTTTTTNFLNTNNISAGLLNVSSIFTNSFTASNISTNSISTNLIKASGISTVTLSTNSLYANTVSSQSIFTNSVSTNGIFAGGISTITLSANTIYVQNLSTQLSIVSSIRANSIQTSNLSTISVNSSNISTINLSANTIYAQFINVPSISSLTIQTNTLSTNLVLANSVSSINMEANLISTNSFFTNSISSLTIQTNTLSTNTLFANSISSLSFEANTVSTNNLYANNISSLFIQTNSFSTNSLAVNSISTLNIRASTISTTVLFTNLLSTPFIQGSTISTFALNTRSISSVQSQTSSLLTGSVTLKGTTSNGLLTTNSNGSLLLFNGSNIGSWVGIATSDLNMCNYSLTNVTNINGTPVANLGGANWWTYGAGGSVNMNGQDINNINNIQILGNGFANQLTVANLAISNGYVINSGQLTSQQTSNMSNNVATNYTIPQIYIDSNHIGGINSFIGTGFEQVLSNNSNTYYFYPIPNLNYYRANIIMTGYDGGGLPLVGGQAYFTFSNRTTNIEIQGENFNSNFPYVYNSNSYGTISINYTDIYDLTNLVNSCNSDYYINLYMNNNNSNTCNYAYLSNYKVTVVFEPILSNY